MTRLQIYKQTSELYQKCSMVGRDKYAAEKIYELTHKYMSIDLITAKTYYRKENGVKEKVLTTITKKA